MLLLTLKGDNKEDVFSIEKLEDLQRINLNTLVDLEVNLDNFKTSVSNSLKIVNKLSNEYTKETQSLQGNIEKVIFSKYNVVIVFF